MCLEGGVASSKQRLALPSLRPRTRVAISGMSCGCHGGAGRASPRHDAAHGQYGAEGCHEAVTKS